MNTRRLFVLLPRDGEPVAVAHRIELQPLDGFPGRMLPYARWEELHAALGSIVKGRRLAMEISPDDAVPYLDRVPAGVVELITGWAGRWCLRRRWSAGSPRAGAPRNWPITAMRRKCWRTSRAASWRGRSSRAARASPRRRCRHGWWRRWRRGVSCSRPTPIVGFGANAANPHYEPEAGKDATLGPDQVILLDLWAGKGAPTRSLPTRPGWAFPDAGCRRRWSRCG